VNVICQYCNQPAKLVTGQKIYPHRPDLHHKHFWECEPCKAFVGCHARGNGYGDGTTPLGILANPQLRQLKSAVHAKFDPAWKSGEFTRSEAYGWLAEQLGIPKHECHIGLFTKEMCHKALRILNQ